MVGLKEGWLRKNHKNSAWTATGTKRRWFVTNGFHVFYYEDNMKSTVRGHFDLRNVVTIRPCADPAAPEAVDIMVAEGAIHNVPKKNLIISFFGDVSEKSKWLALWCSAIAPQFVDAKLKDHADPVITAALNRDHATQARARHRDRTDRTAAATRPRPSPLPPGCPPRPPLAPLHGPAAHTWPLAAPCPQPACSAKRAKFYWSKWARTIALTPRTAGSRAPEEVPATEAAEPAVDLDTPRTADTASTRPLPRTPLISSPLAPRRCSPPTHPPVPRDSPPPPTHTHTHTPHPHLSRPVGSREEPRPRRPSSPHPSRRRRRRRTQTSSPLR